MTDPRYPDAFTLETDADSFLRWLGQHIKAFPKLAPSWGIEPVEGGYLATCGTYVLRNVAGQEYIDPYDPTQAQFLGLGFKVLRPAPHRIEVHPGYDGVGVIEAHFRHILADIAENYPESRETIDGYLKRPAAEPEQAAPSGGKMPIQTEPGCVRWRENVKKYLEGLAADTNPTLQGLADMLVVGHDGVRKQSSKHKHCCFDWLLARRTRQIPS